MSIVIIGGGLGGIAVGIGLIQNGLEDVTIYERDEGMKFFLERSFGQKKKYNLHIQQQELRRILLDRFIQIHPQGSEGIQWNHRLLSIQRDLHQITFTNGSFLTDVDLLIGADGINGIVRSFKYDPKNDLPLNYLGMLVVLGITGSTGHFLSKDRVFQTIDGSFRLFAMPFSKTRSDQSIMWQLSFPCQFDFANYLSKNPIELKKYLLDRCSDWHKPIPSMIENTQLDLLMGIVAFDRDIQSIEVFPSHY